MKGDDVVDDLRSIVFRDGDTWARNRMHAAADEIERLRSELAELKGVVKAYEDDPDYARSRFREIDLLKDQRAHDRLKIDGLERELRGRGALASDDS